MHKNIEWFNNRIDSLNNSTNQISNINITDDPIMVYNLQGRYIGSFQSETEAKSNLSNGLYIIDGQLILIK